MNSPLAANVFWADAASLFPRFNDDLTVVLLMLVFGVAIGLGLACLFVVLHTLRRRPAGERSRGRLPGGPMRLGLHPPPSLREMPGRWLAVSGSTLPAVQRALGLNHVVACSWSEGIAAAGQQMLFLTPPVQGWILVFGASLPDPAADVDECFLCLTRLSRDLGQVQFFSFDRVLNQHAWAMLDRGRVLRAYAWAGRTLWNQGPMTLTERECGLVCLDYGAESDPGGPVKVAMSARNNDLVLQLAARWSVHPAAVGALLAHDGQGVVGEVSQSTAH